MGGPDAALSDAAAPDAAAPDAPDAAAPDAAAPDADAPDARADLPDAAQALAPPGPQRAAALAAAEALSAEDLIAHVAILSDDALGGRDNNTPGAEAAREYLRAVLGPAVTEERFAEGINLVLRLPGADLADEVVVLGAHYDHLGTAGAPGSACRPGLADTICNGAADNASGVAVVLEIAAALHRAPPRRTVEIVLFDAEEDGLLGSQHHVAHMAPPPVAMLNLDMVGAALFPGAYPTFALGVEYTPELSARVTYDGRVAGIVALPVSSYFDGSDEGERSDHYPFRRAGVPALFLSSGAPPEYHSVNDELPVVDPDKLLRTARHALLLLTDLANADARPTFTPTPHPHLGDARALRLLGELVRADPEAAGVDPALLSLLDPLLVRLQGYLDDPPQTEAEWATYDDFVRTLVQTVIRARGL